jgi:multidrug resistance efflux pump
MLESFPLTARLLSRDRIRNHAVLLIIATSIVLGWVSWMLFAHIGVYATSDQARVEVAQEVFHVEAPTSGMVGKTYMKEGDQVSAGSVLVDLQADPQQLQIQAEQDKQQTLNSQLDDMRHEADAQERSLVAERAASRSSVQQASAAVAEAQDTAELAQETFNKEEELYQNGLVSELQVHTTENDLKKKKVELQSARAALSRAQREAVISGGTQQAQIDELNANIAKLEGDIASSQNSTQQLQNQLGWHHIVAPGPGRLDEVANLKPGTYVHQGDQLATVVPNGKLRVVADFEPSVAIGRIQPGQIGRLRLTGYPWEQYGSIRARVTNVGTEVQNGRVRVELVPVGDPNVPLQHGLPGSLEIQVGRVTPAAFLLKTTGVDYRKIAANESSASRAAMQ